MREERLNWLERMTDWLARIINGVLAALLFPVLRRSVPTEAEKYACITMQDLARLGYAHPIDPTRERWSATAGRFDRSRTAKYEYELLELTQYCSLGSEIELLTSVSDAILVYKASRLARVAWKTNKVAEIREHDREAVLFDILDRKGGIAMGTHFTVRSGCNVLTMSLIGPRFDDVEEWRGFIAERIERMDPLSRV